ncbi:MAG: AAA family ATPase [Angustibacter sp.]
MAERVVVRRFKSLGDVSLDLHSMTCLVGPNNSGKSSVLQAIQFGVSVVQSLALDAGKGVPSAGTLATDQLVYTPLRDVQTLARGGVLRQRAETQIEVEFFHGPYAAQVAVRRGRNKNITVSVEGDSELIAQLSSLENPYSVIAPGLAGIPSYEEFRSSGIVRRAAARGDANSVFRNVLWILKQNVAEWDAFQRRLRAVFPDAEVDLVFDEANDEHINATIARAGYRLPIDASGTGILQAAQILAYVGVYKPQLLILDEPDSHLHPDNQRILVRLLNEVAQEAEFQVLLSTHSRHMLDECLALGCRTHWISSGSLEATDFRRVDALLGLGALDVGDRLRNGSVRYVVLTEDADSRYMRALLDANGLGGDDCTVWSYKGCTSLTGATAMAQFIQDSSPGVRVIVHRDRDFLSDNEVAKANEKYEAKGLPIYWTRGVDIESDFLTEDHLEIVYGDRATAEALLADATREVRDASVHVMINSRTTDAFAFRREGGPVVDVGQISAEAHSDFDSAPSRYRHGKKALKIVNRLAQERLGKSRRLDTPTSALRSEVLQEFREGEAGSSAGEEPSAS